MRTEDVQTLFVNLHPTLDVGSRATRPAYLSLAAPVLAKISIALGLPTTFSVAT